MTYRGKYQKIKYGFGIDYGDNPSTTTTISSGTVSNGGSTSNSIIPFTVTFSKPVTGFTSGDITVSSGTVQNFTAVSTSVYTFDLYSPSPGVDDVDVGAAVVLDGAQEPNTAATEYSFTFLSNDVSGLISGTRTSENWIGTITFGSNITIPSGTTVTVDTGAFIESNNYVILVQDGGYLDTEGKRLPKSSALGSVIVFN